MQTVASSGSVSLSVFLPLVAPLQDRFAYRRPATSDDEDEDADDKDSGGGDDGSKDSEDSKRKISKDLAKWKCAI